MSYVETKEMSITYPLEQHASLPPVSVGIEKGEKILILGASGCGKSTLALALQGLIPRSIDAKRSGSVTVDGTDPKSWTAKQASSHIGVLFQDPQTQFCMLTVEDEIIFGLENLGLSKEEIKRRLEESLALTNLTDRRHDALQTLSGGLQQKAAFACLLAMDANTLIVDEPTANLDPESSKDLLQCLADVSEQKNKTVLCIEHKLDDVLPIIDRVIALSSSGGVFAQGQPRTFFQQNTSLLQDAGIAIPEVCEMAFKLEQEGLVTWGCFPLTLREWEAECQRLGIQKTNHMPCPSEVAASSEPILETNALSFSYRKQPVLQHVTFSLHRGQFVALTGANGSGKSTLFQLLSGIYTPAQGDVALHGKSRHDISDSDWMQHIGYVFQNPEHQFICDTVEEELTYGLKMKGTSPAVIASQVDELLETFSLTAKRAANPFSLSQGQKRRLSVATMLTSDQDILLLDEPTFGQDEANTTAMMDLLLALHRRGKTIVMITHDMELVYQYADHILLLHEGTIAYDGPTDAFFENTTLLKQAHLTPPINRELAGWLPSFQKEEVL
ncbi:energy-coupling factor transport system ATP-binding protein [Alteribacillus persepolensis]|uniref:Energy-coupling factor transport system ATP-binding protein n=1 Tax=Alteribacillus persepolensis TaxID=568899 RepID=A0A1G8AZ46_9BACI|nr:ABC transporter ATP-binding protein [Alteribacillus persepolensis]SDH26218.1 energy-coupling factor transport system ATP-binding protein [Alteribacillus persepolensis]